MQTPGKRVESLTPMIAINRRVNTVFSRLSKVEEDVIEIERPQQRMFGRILSQFQTVNSSMDTMEDLIRQDIAAKKRYYAEEKKILEKDSKNLQGVRSGLGRQLAAGALGAAGISQILQGNVGEGLAGVGGAAALLSPEILGVISTVVTAKLAKSGLLGRGSGLGTMGSRVAGASKLKNPLLITAALAASLILPGLINSNQNADRRRQLSATKTIRGAETINKPDVDRFRGILARFDSLLPSVSTDRRKKGEGGLDEELISESEDVKTNKKDENIPPVEEAGFGDIFNQLTNPFAGDDIPDEEQFTQFGPFKLPKSLRFDDLMRFQGFDPDKDPSDDKVSSSTTILRDKKNTASNTLVGNDLVSMNMVESNQQLDSSQLGDMSIEMILGDNANNNQKGEPNVINLQDDDEQSDQSSGFSGLTATPTFVSVGTKFTSSGGTIDKFVSANALGAGMGLA
jgi:hypothetical protein